MTERLIKLIDNYRDACWRPSCDDLAKSARKALEDYVSSYVKALTDLTPSGSEFVDDPERCAQHVRDNSASQHRLFVEAHPQRIKWSMICSRLGLVDHTQVCAADILDPLERIGGLERGSIIHLSLLEEKVSRMRMALEKVKLYNEDIRDEKINYRPEDHIQVINEALK